MARSNAGEFIGKCEDSRQEETSLTKGKKLCDNLENNIWGRAYQIIFKRFGVANGRVVILPELSFPCRYKIVWQKTKGAMLKQFDTGKLTTAIDNM